MAGLVIGAAMALSNLYVVLKTGWSFGVTVTAVLLGFAVFKALGAVGISKRPLGLLENSAVASVASSAGYMTGGGNMAALPALFMLTGAAPAPVALVLWFACIAALGVCTAIPIKKALIERDALPFPTGIATAETLKSVHGDGSSPRTKRLGWAAASGAALAWFRDAQTAWMPLRIPAHVPLPFRIGSRPAADLTWSLDLSLLLIAGGAIAGFRVGWSMLAGAIVTYGFIAPYALDHGLVASANYKKIVQFTLWPGAGMLISAALVSFSFQWRSIVRAVWDALPRGRSAATVPHGEAVGEAVAASDGGARTASNDECPPSWFLGGYALLGPIVVVLMHHLFAVPYWVGAVTMPLAVVMGLVAARVTGETDTTPTKALGPVTQFLYGTLVPGHLPANLMGANVTGGIGLHAADLLTDLKCGFLIGARPRQQFLAQALGVLSGALAVVPAFFLLVPTPDALGTAALPAPAVQVWAGVSKVMVEGASALGAEARLAAQLGVVTGVLLALAEKLLPSRLRRFVPSPSAMGIAFVMPASNAMAFFVGGVLAALAVRADRGPAAPPSHGVGIQGTPACMSWVDDQLVPIASGIIAGESLMGIAVAILTALGILGVR
jgi:OPT family oligopeptide transporter